MKSNTKKKKQIKNACNFKNSISEYKIVFFLILISISILRLFISSGTNREKYMSFQENNAVNQYFRINYSDPFQYIENLEDSTVLELLKQQNNWAEKYILGINNYPKLLGKKNMLKSSDVKVSNLKITKENKYFYLKQDSSKPFPMLFTKQGSSGKEELLYNPEIFRPNNKDVYLINYIKPSWDGEKVAISMTKNDEEISDIIVIDVETKNILPDIISNSDPSSLGGISWLPDNSGFIYTHLPVIDKTSKDFLKHTSAVLYTLNKGKTGIRTLLSKVNNPDLEIKSTDFPLASCEVENSKYIFCRLAGARYFDDYYYTSIDSIHNEIKWLPLYKQEDKIYEFYFDGDNIIYRTAKNAPNYKLCKTSIKNPDFQNPEVLVEEDPYSVLEEFIVCKNAIYIVKVRNGVEANLFCYSNNSIKKLQLPQKSGSVSLSNISPKHNELWVETKGWISNSIRYRYDYKSNIFIEENIYPVTKNKELEDCIVEEIEVKSHDGVMVPLSIIYKKGTQLNGETPLFIGGYGCYGYSFTPSLRSNLYHWVSEGGIFALAHVRGGGEKGDIWHKNGYKKSKPNSWKDFIACTEYLIQKKYTNPNKIVAWSESAGGILIGRAITERPDLYKAAIIGNGLLNTMRLEYGYNSGDADVEFGSVKDSVSIQYLYEMDAYHHIKKGVKYPALYLTTGMNDARLPAWQPAKFAAKMQMANAANNVTLLSVNFEGGHGFNALTSKRNEEIAHTMAFAFWQTGHPDYQLKIGK